MTTYARLHKAIGRPAHAVAVPDEVLAAVPEHLREDVVPLWQEDGWASYGDGLLWTVDARELDDVLEAWPQVPAGAFVFARSGFGDLFVHHADSVRWLEVQTGELSELGPEIYLFLNSTLGRAESRDVYLREARFRKVRKRLGELAADECYGPRLALALGGDDQPPSYQRVKLREYLHVCAQLQG